MNNSTTTFPIIIFWHLVSYQREVDKGKLTAVANFEKLMFRARALPRSKVHDCGLYGVYCLGVWSYVIICGIIATEDAWKN